MKTHRRAHRAGVQRFADQVVADEVLAIPEYLRIACCDPMHPVRADVLGTGPIDTRAAQRAAQHVADRNVVAGDLQRNHLDAD